MELPKILDLLDGTEAPRKIVRQVFVDLNSPKTIPGSEGTAETVKPALISPVELMIVLHTLEDTIGLKRAVEGMILIMRFLMYLKSLVATSICFDLKEVYTQEVLAMVLQQLVDLAKLPILLMRTVIQSVTIYKELSGFVNSILTRLIMKKIWTFPKLWDGFIRCCTVRSTHALSQARSFTSELID